MTCLYIYSSANPDWIHDRRAFDPQRNRSIGAPVAKLSDTLYPIYRDAVTISAGPVGA
jgi:hypothetical protein